MFGINGPEAVIIVLIALFVIGPDRIPEYAEQLRELVKAAKRYATGAKTDLQDTFGPEFAEVDWKKLDPRQYDPRTIVRQALLEDDDDPHRDAALREQIDRDQNEPLAAVPADVPVQEHATDRLAVVSRSAGAPFDDEAT